MGLICVFFAYSPNEIESRVENPELIFEDDENGKKEFVDVDKTWDAFHYFFAGSSTNAKFPQNFILDGETFGEDEEFALFNPSEVVRIAKFLNGFDRDALFALFRPNEMDEIYPEIWRSEAPNELFDDWLWPTFEKMRTFFDEYSQKGAFVVRSIC